jgi:hypothetical protein
MKVEYTFNTFSEKKMLYAVGDLLKYYADMSVRIREKLEMLQKNERARDILTNYLRKGTGNMAVTIDSVFGAVEQAVKDGDMFVFSIDGTKFCDIFNGKQKVVFEVSMKENYFLTESVLSHFIPLRGGFRTKKYPEGVAGEKLKWLDWMDDNWRRDYKIAEFNRRILEE